MIHCSFCGASQEQAEIIILSEGGASICEKCVEESAKTVEAHRQQMTARATSAWPYDDMGTPV